MIEFYFFLNYFHGREDKNKIKKNETISVAEHHGKTKTTYKTLRRVNEKEREKK